MKQRRLSSVFTTNYSEGAFQEIEVQVLLRNGLPRFEIIGLPQRLIREGKDRVLSALAHLGIELPAQKILVNLRPGSIPKEGSHFDLPILAAILKALGVYPQDSERQFFWGELGLDGSLRTFEDFLPHYLFASGCQATEMTFNFDSQSYHELKDWLSPRIHKISRIEEIFESHPPPKEAPEESLQIDQKIQSIWLNEKEDFLWDQLNGSPSQFLLWAMVASFRLHLLIQGPPGCGKSTWSSAIRDLLPPLPSHLWDRRVLGAHCQIRKWDDVWRRPMLTPHHSSSRTSIVGGGSETISPGALSQAHLGVMFLDEIAEFSRDVIEALREPLESKHLTIARGVTQRRLPADTQILAAMNPCPCGLWGTKKQCRCSTSSFYAYQNKLSEPLKDRFHLRLWWTYNSQKPSAEWKVHEVRRRILNTLSQPKPQFTGLELEMGWSPRRQRLWLEAFSAWCQWNGVSSAHKGDQLQFEKFISEMKDEDTNDG